MSDKKFRLAFLFAVAVSSAISVSSLLYAQRAATDSKTSATLRNSFAASVKEASKSTVLIKVRDAGDAKNAALGTVLSSDGYILTKGTEVLGHRRVTVTMPLERNTGYKDVDAKILGFYEPYDLAMLKIEATGLIPVKFADTSEPSRPPGPTVIVGRRGLVATGPIPTVAPTAVPPEGAIPVEVGEFVITPDAVASIGKDLFPKSYGVISVTRRSIPWSSGVMGVELADSSTVAGALITNVFTKSGASKAGIQKNDIITAVDGTEVVNRASLQAIIRGKRPADTVMLSVTRGTQKLSIAVQLGDTILATMEDIEMDVLSGQTNTRSTGFPSVFQHDTVLYPTDMGGPLVDLAGRVIGINIARAGRTETYAIPADLLIPRLLQAMKDGDWPVPQKAAPVKP